ncbi:MULTISPECIES: hypothetical protein [Methanothrix]|uniref:hypothetical protein n=2 Tax=Methanotrichaceae TaxID=143067 RepID=UPI001B75CE25|nr:hypothetical protein [Methanothrix sp.]HOE45101.1 hypothetical protein [Methanothrix soehngenii]MBP7068511.1 hypothetical protein [Methanothrix sp.]HOS21506.1 hypothetical protein [Methanothrix soehngenii]HPL19978.1 hypothetical protein [Methanothrix soehngenii]HRW33248.1 hypothetical protein [Methanothrix sp.]
MASITVNDSTKGIWAGDKPHEKRSEFLKLFEEFVNSYMVEPEGKTHLAYYALGRVQARNNLESIKLAANRGEIVEDQVLLKLMPYLDSQSNRDQGNWISIAPAFAADLRIKFEAAEWRKDGWREVADSILNFITRCDEHPEQLLMACKEFSASPYSKGFQAGTLSPILNALRPDSFVLFNKKSRLVLNYFTGKIYAQSLNDYPMANSTALVLIGDVSEDLRNLSKRDLNAVDLFDMFSHWLVAIKKYPPLMPLFKTKGKVGDKIINTLVSVPEAEEPEDNQQCISSSDETTPSSTDHTQIQFYLLTLGSEMGLDVWVARNDRSKIWQGKTLGSLPNIVEQLPTQFNETTQRTIELIDVLWLKGNSIISAFEVECTTSIYSGLLRMSDLLALQPNLDIKLYLVAPDERRDKVEQEILRPTFQFRPKPLKNVCGYLSLDGLMEKMEGIKRLGLPYSSLNPNFLADIAEYFGGDNVS